MIELSWNGLPASKQRVIDRFVVGYGTDIRFKLSAVPHGYPSSPDVLVLVNGKPVNNINEQPNG